MCKSSLHVDLHMLEYINIIELWNCTFRSTLHSQVKFSEKSTSCSMELGAVRRNTNLLIAHHSYVITSISVKTKYYSNLQNSSSLLKVSNEHNVFYLILDKNHKAKNSRQVKEPAMLSHNLHLWSWFTWKTIRNLPQKNCVCILTQICALTSVNLGRQQRIR